MRRWTRTDDRLLELLYENRFGAEIISYVLSRTVSAIYNRAYRMKIVTLRESRQSVEAIRKVLKNRKW